MGLVTISAPPLIPPSIRPYVAAWWDAGRRNAVYYAMPQIATNGNFANGTTGWGGTFGTVSASDNTLRVTGNGAQSFSIGGQLSSISWVEGKVVYIRAKMRVTNPDCINLMLAVRKDTVTGVSIASKTQANPAENTWYDMSAIGTGASAAAMYFTVSEQYPNSATANGKVLEVREVVAIDLTAAFGAGNEPAAAELDAMLAADGAAYWNGSRNILCNPLSKYYWHDFSGNGRHMKLFNFAYTPSDGWSEGKPPFLRTDGVDSCGRYSVAGLNAANTSFSALCAFSVPNLTGTKYIIISTESGVQSMYLTVSGATLTLSISDSVSGTATAEYTIEANKIYLASCAYDQTDKKARLYVNGVLVATTDALTNGLASSNQVNFARSGGGSAYSASNIYALAYASGRALSDAENGQIWSANHRRFKI